MLEGLLKWGVDYLLKDYVIIDPNAAKTNILEGKIEFENLELRPDLLEKVGVSGYSLKAGYIGKLHVHISPFNYSSQPANVVIDGIYLLVVPSHETVIKVDKDTKMKRRVEDKLRTLAKIEEMRAKKVEAEESAESAAEAQNKKDGFLLRQVMAIVRNLQITVNNIHIRLEDASTDPTCKVSLGVSMESLTLRTCNEKWEETLVTQSSDVFFKVARLQSLAFYFTTNSKLYSEQPPADRKSLKGILRATIAKEGGRLPPAYEYLVKPLSADARVWVVPNPRRCKSGQAQLYMDMVIHDVAIAASKTQVHSAIALIESTDLLRMKNKYKKFRPADLSSPKAKWDFAIKCILVKTVRPKLDVWKWENIKRHRDTCNKYQQIMEKIYSSKSNNVKLTEAEEMEKTLAEATLDVFDLDLCRRLAQQSVKLTKEALAKEQKRKKQEKSSGGWFGWGSSKKKNKSEQESTPESFEETVENEIEKGMNDSKTKAELYKALGYDDSEDSGMMNYSLMPKDFIQMEIGVGLKKFSVALAEDIGGGVMQNVSKISMLNMKTSLIRQPTPNYLKAKFDLGRLEIDGSLDIHDDPKNTKTPQLLSIVQQNSTKSLISIVFEMNPLTNTDVDFAIQVRSESVQVTYDCRTIQNLIDFFKTKHEPTLVVDDVKDAANRQMKKFSNTSTAGVLYLLEKHKVIFLDVDLEPSFALIPAEGKIRPDKPVVIFKTGSLQVVTQNTKSAFRSAKAATENSAKQLTHTNTFDEIKDKPYDRYNCTLSQVQLFYLEQSYNWKEVAFNPDSSESLVKPIVLTFNLQKCLVMDDPEFPVIKVAGALQDLSVKISDLKMIRLMIFLKDLKFPKTEDYSVPVATDPNITKKPSVQVYKGKQATQIDDVLQHLDQLEAFIPLAAGDQRDRKEGKSEVVPTSKQLTMVKLKYTIHKVSILLMEDRTPVGIQPGSAGSEGYVKPLMKAELNNLYIGLLKKNYEIPITLSLESVSIVHLQIRHGSEHLKFLESKLNSSDGDTKNKQKLVEVNIRIAERKAPVFHTEYNSVEYQIETKVQTVALRLHLEAVLSALEFQKGLFERLFPEEQNVITEDGEGFVQQTLEVPDVVNTEVPGQDMVDKIDQYNQMFSRERKTKLIQLQYWASIKEIEIAVSSDNVDRDIANMRFEGLSYFVEVVPAETITFKASLESLNIRDSIPNTIYPNIFKVSGNEVFDLEVIYFFTATKGNGYLDMSKSDLTVRLKTGTPRIVYVHRFVNALIEFTNHFTEEKKRLEAASSNVLKNTADLAQTVYDKAFRIKLDLEISAPSLVIPKNSMSDQVIYANLGQMKIANNFKLVEADKGKAILDSLNLKLQDVKVTRAILDDHGQSKAECHLLEPSVMEIDLVRNLTPLLKTDQPGLEVNGKIVRLEASLGQADVQMCYEILFGNFGEVDTSGKKGSRPSSASRSRGRKLSKQGRLSKQSSRASSVQSRSGNRSGNRSRRVSGSDNAVAKSSAAKPTEKLVTFKAEFSIESVCAQLYSDRIQLTSGLVKRDPRSNLAKFELLTMNVKLKMLSDGDMTFHANMMDCILDDSRQISTGAIMRMMQRKRKGDSLTNSGDYSSPRLHSVAESTESGEDTSCYMIALDYVKDTARDEEKIDMVLNDMYLCVCTDFLMSVGDFFLKNKPVMTSQDSSDKLAKGEKEVTAALETIQEEDDAEDLGATLVPPTDAANQEEGSNLTRIIGISFRNPEIVLVSDTRNDYSPCLILTWKVRSSIVMRSQQLTLTALINDIELICCPFKSTLRKGNTKQVIPKFSMQAFANQSDSFKQQNMNIDVEELDFNISPAVIKIMQAVAAVMSQHQILEDSNDNYGVTDAIWAPKQVTKDDIAFLRGPVASPAKFSSVDVPESQIQPTESQSAFLNVPRITVKFDISDSTGITQPILLIESALSVRINNYISREKLHIVAEMNFGVEYFNDLVSSWEPVIEPNKFITDRGKVMHELWSVKTEMKHNAEGSLVDPGSDENPALWDVDISAHRSLEMTVTSQLLICLEMIKEAFADSFTVVYTDDQQQQQQQSVSFGDVAPYAIVNESGQEMTVLVPRDFTVVGRDIQQIDTYNNGGPDQTSLVGLLPMDRIELAPNSNMSAAKFRRLTSQGTFMRSSSMSSNIASAAGDAEEDESLKVRFHIIVPGSQTISDVSLTKPGFHFYNILPLHEYKFSLVVQNGLTPNGQQNVCTISSPLILHNHFDIAFDVYDGKRRIGTVEPGERFWVPMEQAFYPLDSKMRVKPKVKEGERAKWTFTQRAIDWRVIKKHGGAKRYLLECCEVDPNYVITNEFNPLRMILQLETIKFGTIRGRLHETPHYVIHIKPTCLLRNLSPYPIYHRLTTLQGKEPRAYRMLAYGEQEVIHEVVLNNTKVDIDVTDQTDKRYFGLITMRKQNQTITYGQWFDQGKHSSLVMGVSWEYDESNFLIMSIFAPYWIVNRLERDLYIKRADDDKVTTHPRDFGGITIFTPSSKDSVDKIKLCVRVDSSLFSDPLNVQAVGNAEVATCPRRSGGDLLVGVTNTLSKMKLTKIIVITPNYILLNNTKYNLEYAQYFPGQQNEDPKAWKPLLESAVVGIWPETQDSNSDNKKTMSLMLRYAGGEECRSKPFYIWRADEFLIRMPKIGCLHVSVSVSESATTITVNTYFPGAAPVKLYNLTDRQILLWQNQNPDLAEKTYVLSPGNHMLFTWTDPTAQRSLCYKLEGQITKTPSGGKNKNSSSTPHFDLQKDEFQEIQCEGEGGSNTKYYATSMLCRQQRVLLFTDDQCLATGTKEQKLHETFTYDINLELYGLGLSLVNNTVKKELPKEIFYAGVTPTDVTWLFYGKGKKHWRSFSINNIAKIEEVYQNYQNQLKANNPKVSHQVSVVLGGTEHVFDFSTNPILLLKPDKRKIKRTYLHGISVNYQMSPNVTHFHFKMNRLQIDDPLPTCMFPVVLAPVPPPRSIVGDREPAAFVEASVVMQRGSGQLLLFKYCKVLIQEFSVKIDTTFLGALQMFFKGNEITTNVQKYLEMDVDLAHTQLADTEAVQIARGTLRHYYQDLNFGPIKMLLSLSLARGENETALLPIDNSFIDGITQTLGVVLTEQHDTCIKLSYFERKNRFMTVKQLMNQAQKFYTNQVVRQFYYFFANLDALGNPQKLFLGIKEGGTDLFYEPYQGAILGPAEFVEGLGIGVKSLGSHAIGGVFGVASSVTASAGQAIAFLSFDEKHKQERRNDMRDKPQHVGQGLTKGFKRFGSGVFGGVTGVITQPIQGVKKDGAKGLVTGIGKGAAGLVVKPVGGVVDLASNTFEGIRGSADDAVVLRLLRTPRVVRADSVVRPYDSYEADGNAILTALRNNQKYNAHVYTYKGRKGAIIVTNRALIHAEKRALVQAFERWETLSQFQFKDITALPPNDMDDEQFKVVLKADKGKTVTKILTVQAVNKKFLWERATQAYEEFIKMKASAD